MTEKKIIEGDYTDATTGLRFVEDTRGNYHLVYGNESEQNITVVLDGNETTEKQNKRLKRILESLRRENVWLWEIVEVARRTFEKKGAKKAMEDLIKTIKERQR